MSDEEGGWTEKPTLAGGEYVGQNGAGIKKSVIVDGAMLVNFFISLRV